MNWVEYCTSYVADASSTIMQHNHAAQSCSTQHNYITNTQTNKCYSENKYEKIIKSTKTSKISVLKQIRALMDVFTKIAQAEHCSKTGVEQQNSVAIDQKHQLQRHKKTYN